MPSLQTWLISLSIAFATSAFATRALAGAATRLRLMDHPGGRKQHRRAVPLVGGVAIYVAYLIASLAAGEARAYLVLALSMVVAVGVWDDVAEVSPRAKFAVQIAASALMIFGAGIQLATLGDLLGWRTIGLWVFGVPLTVFAIVGVVNSLNMLDGLDGLAGCVSLVAFAWYAAVASVSGLGSQFITAIILCGAIGGFLLFNLRSPWQPSATVFLGDAGSLAMGFALGWFAVDLTQGEGRSFPPIAALWVLLLPLADCVSLMTRRLSARRNPFVADNHHIHHYLLARGFTHTQTLAILLTASAVFGAIGFFGWRLGIPEPILFWPFFFGYFAYHFWIKAAWRTLDGRRQAAAASVEEDEEAISAA